MKIVIIGGTGFIGSKTAERLRKQGHEVVAASRKTGINAVTGEGLAAALAGAQVVLDLANSPSFEEKAVMEFFKTAGRNLLAAEATAGVKHHIALSVVGVDRPPGNAYFRAKLVQEELIKGSKIPYTIVRSTQFLEFTGAIAQEATVGQTVTLSPVFYQPIAAEDVADVMADVAQGAPVNGMMEIAGPEKVRLNELIERFLTAIKDPRKVVTDPKARYYGQELNDESLVPEGKARLGKIRFEEWVKQALAKK